MLRNRTAKILIFIILSSCKNEELILPHPNEKHFIGRDCIDTAIIPQTNVPNSHDLYKYKIRNSNYYGKAIKSVPTQGYVEWNSNVCVDKFRKNYSLVFMNYADTTNWIQYTKYAYAREIIVCDINLFDTSKQFIYSDHLFNRDSTLKRGAYFKNASDGDVSDASWEIDTNYVNYIKVICNDTIKKVIEGEFEFHFRLTEQSSFFPQVKYYEQAFFKCGHYKAKYEN